MSKVLQDRWLKFKKYPHIGEQLTRSRDGGWVKKYVTNPSKIAAHKFVPLLHRVITQRKFRPTEGAEKNPGGKRIRTATPPKKRHIYFPSHLDSMVYSYYSELLANSYEAYLKDKPYGMSAVAYRKIPKLDAECGNKCNIEFAYEAFEFINNNKDRKLSVIVADITSFFDNLNHKLLHRQWKKVLGVNNLPDDHYVVYKSLVDFKYVNETELFSRFQYKLIVERFRPNDKTQKQFKRKYVNKMKNLRSENVVAYCDKPSFFREATDLIRADKPYNSTIRKSIEKETKVGIPQGTPLSATLANIYMIDFDNHIYSAAKSLNKNAYYQRYSDDIIIICNQNDEAYFYDLIQREVSDKALLQVQRDKTHIYRYQQGEDGVFCGGKLIDTENINQNKQIEYLGFIYDGERVLVKTVGFSRFYRKMKRSFKRGAHFAKASHIPYKSLFKQRLYKRFTHCGAKRRMKWLPCKDSPSGYKRSTQYDWGNFISYINKADKVMMGINAENYISKQYRRVWSKFHKIMKATESDISKISIRSKM